VVLKALAKDPPARYQTAAEFDEAIVRASDRATIASASQPAESRPRLPAPTTSQVEILAHGRALPASPRDSAIASLSLAARQIAPDFGGRVAHPTLPAPVSSMPVPDLLGAASSPFLSKQQLTIGLAAGTCLGVVMVALWLFAK
jgi:hypothetical protein